jgi:hypothetical protein
MVSRLSRKRSIGGRIANAWCGRSGDQTQLRHDFREPAALGVGHAPGADGQTMLAAHPRTKTNGSWQSRIRPGIEILVQGRDDNHELPSFPNHGRQSSSRGRGTGRRSLSPAERAAHSRLSTEHRNGRVGSSAQRGPFLQRDPCLHGQVRRGGAAGERPTSARGRPNGYSPRLLPIALKPAKWLTSTTRRVSRSRS